jgi:hypothetical protein
MHALLVTAEVLVAIAVAYAIVRYIVIPAMRETDSTGTGSQSPREGKNDKL